MDGARRRGPLDSATHSATNGATNSATHSALDSTSSGVSVEWQLAPGDAVAARAIRHAITGCLREAAGVQADQADLDAAELVVGEVLSNVVRHTSSPATVGLGWQAGHPVLSVTEPDTTEPPVTPSDGLPAHALPDDPLATGGRGLYLVSRLSKGLTVDSAERGTTIRVTLDLSRPATSDPQA